MGLGIGGGIANGLQLKGAVNIQVGVNQLSGHPILREGFSGHAADGCHTNAVRQCGLGKGFCHRLCPGGKVAAHGHHAATIACDCQLVLGGRGCFRRVDCSSYNAQVSAGGSAGLCIGLAVDALSDELGIDIDAAANGQFSAVVELGILLCLQVRIDHIHRDIHAADGNLCGLAKGLCADTAQVGNNHTSPDVSAPRCAKHRRAGAFGGGVCHIAASGNEARLQGAGSAGLRVGFRLILVAEGHGSCVNFIRVHVGVHAALCIGAGNQDGRIVHANFASSVNIGLGKECAVHFHNHIVGGIDDTTQNAGLRLCFHVGICRGFLAADHGNGQTAVSTAAAAYLGSRAAVGGIVEPGNHTDVAIFPGNRGRLALGADMGCVGCGNGGYHIVRGNLNVVIGQGRGQNLSIRLRSAFAQDIDADGCFPALTVRLSWVRLHFAVAFDACTGIAAGIRNGRVHSDAAAEIDRNAICGLLALRFGQGLIPVRQAQLPGGDLLASGGNQIRSGGTAGIGMNRGNRAGEIADIVCTVDTGIREGIGSRGDAEIAVDDTGNAGGKGFIDCIEVCDADIGVAAHHGNLNSCAGRCTDSGNCTAIVAVVIQGIDALVQVGDQGHISVRGIQRTVTDEGILPHPVHRNSNVCRHIDSTKAGSRCDDICLCQRIALGRYAHIPGRGYGAAAADTRVRAGRGIGCRSVQANILGTDFYTACRRGYLGIRDRVIGIGDSHAVTRNVPVGFHDSLKGAGCEGKAYHHTHALDRDVQVIDLRIGFGIRAIGNRYSARASGKAGNRAAGGIGQRHSAVCGDRCHSDRCGVNTGFCCVFERNAQILCDLFAIFFALLLGSQGFGACGGQNGANRQAVPNRQYRVGVHVGLLLGTDPGKRQGCGCCPEGKRRVDNQGMCLGAAVSQYLDALCAQRSAGTQNLSIVHSLVEGQGQVDCIGSHAGCAGNGDGLAIAVVGLRLGAGVDRYVAGCAKRRTRQIQDGLVGRTNVSHIHGSAHSNRAAYEAGREHHDVAIDGCGHRDITVGAVGAGIIAGGDMDTTDRRDVSDEAQAQGHAAVDGNAAGCDTRTVDGRIALGFCGNIDALYGDTAGNGCDFGIAAVADVGFGIQLVDHYRNGCAHGDSAAGNGDHKCVGIGLEIMLDRQSCLGSINEDILIDIAANRGAVHCQTHAGIDTHCTRCQTAHCYGGIGLAGGDDIQLGEVGVGNVGIADDGCLGLTLEISRCQRNVDTRETGCKTGIHNEYITVIHPGLDFQGFGVGNIACQNCLGGGEHGHNRTADTNARNAAAYGDGDQAHGVLAGRGNVLLLKLVVSFPGRTKALNFGNLLGSLDGCACACQDDDILTGVQGSVVGNQRLNIGIENGDCETHAHACRAADGHGTGDDIGVQGIGGLNLNISSCGNGSAGGNTGRSGVGQAGDGLCRQLVVLSSLLILGRIEGIRAGQIGFNIFVLFTVVEVALGILVLACCLFVCDGNIFSIDQNVELTVALDRSGVRVGILIGLTVVAVVFRSQFLPITRQEGIQRIGGLILPGCGMGSVECAIHLSLRIHCTILTAGIQGIMGILAQHIACHNGSQGRTHTSHAGTGYGGADAEHIPDGFCQNLRVVHIDTAAAEARVDGIEADAHQSGNAHSRSAGAGNGGGNRTKGVIVLCFNLEVPVRVDIDVGIGVGLGLDLGDNHIQGAAHGCYAAAGNTGRVRIHGFPGVCQDGNIAADVVIESTCIGSATQECVGFIPEVGNDCHCGYSSTAGSRSRGCNVVQLAVSSCLYIQVAVCLDIAAQGSRGLVHKDQCADIACHAGGAGNAKSDRQQHNLILVAAVQTGNDGYGSIRSNAAGGANGGLYFLGEYQGYHGSADTEAAGGRQSACQVQ